MARDLLVSDWLGHMQKEYLSGFISDGGSTIKFLVAESETRADLKSSLQDLTGNYMVVSLDATVTRFHMPQDIFFAMASQIDWRALARRFLVKSARQASMPVDNIDPDCPSNIFEALADADNRTEENVWIELRPYLDKLFRRKEMSKDFKVGMVQLCRQERSSDYHYAGQPIIDWLTDPSTAKSAVRPFNIYNSISRITARHFMESALFWVRYVGYAGTVILLDNSRVTMPRNPRDGMRYYTRNMVLDHYELLRQFIDGIDRLSGTMILVATEAEFLNPEPEKPARGYGIYPALRTRVMDDVRDKTLVNPVASLIRLR